MQPTSSAYEAFHRALEVIKRFAEDEGSLVLNVVMEIRFTKNSNSPLSPAYGHEVGVVTDTINLSMPVFDNPEDPSGLTFENGCTEELLYVQGHGCHPTLHEDHRRQGPFRSDLSTSSTQS